MNLKVAKEIYKNYYEVVIANDFDKESVELFRKKKIFV